MRSTAAIVPALLAPAALLALDPDGLAPFGPAKWLVIPTLVLAGAAVLARDRPLRTTPRIAWPGCAFLVVVTLAALAGVDRVYAWIGTPERHFGAVTWLLCALAFLTGQALDGEEGRRTARWAVVALGIVGAWATAEALGWRPLDLVGAGRRPVATLGSSAYLGAAAALLVPPAAGIALDVSFTRRWRGLAAVGAALGTVALVVSGARAAWVGALVAAVVLLAVRRPPRRLVLAAMAGVVVIVALSGVVGRIPDALSERDGGARGRLDEWRVAARVVADHPLLGVGPEGYRIAFGGAVDDAYEQAHGRETLPDRAHDAVLDVAVTTGVPGAVVYVVLLGAVGGIVLGGLRRRPWLAGTAAGLLAYTVQSLFLFPLAELDPVAWLLAGVVVAQVAPAPLAGRHLPAVAPVVFGALAVVAALLGGLDLVADRRADAALASAAPTDPAGAARLRPDAVRYRLAAARAFQANGSSIGLDRALAQVRRALDVSPGDPVARGEEARLLLQRARRSGLPAHARSAVRALQALADDDPRNAIVLLRLGVARAATGDDGGAERAWRRAEHLAPRSASASVDLALLYERTGRPGAARRAAAKALARQPDLAGADDLRRLAGT